MNQFHRLGGQGPIWSKMVPKWTNSTVWAARAWSGRKWYQNEPISPSGRPGPSTRRLFEHSGAILGPLKMRKSFNKRIPCLTKEFHCLTKEFVSVLAKSRLLTKEFHCLTKEFRFVTLTKEFHSNMLKKLLKLRKSFNKRIPCLTKEFRCLTKEFVRVPAKDRQSTGEGPGHIVLNWCF